MEEAVDVLPVPVDCLRASAQHLQVEQPLANQWLKPRLSVTVRGSRQRWSGGLLLGVCGDDHGAEQFLLYGARSPRQPLRPAHGQKPKWSVEWFRVFRRPSGLRKTKWFWTSCRHFTSPFRLPGASLTAPGKRRKPAQWAGFRIQPIASGAIEKARWRRERDSNPRRLAP